MFTYHKLLLNFTKTLEARCQLEVVVCVGLGNSRHNGDVVAFGADIMSAGNDCNVDIFMAFSTRFGTQMDKNSPFLRPT